MGICEITEGIYHSMGKALNRTRIIAGAGLLSIALTAGCAGSCGSSNSGGGGGGGSAPKNEAPMLAALAYQNFDENSGFHDNVMDLWQYAADRESADDKMDYSITGQTDTSVTDCTMDSNKYIDCTVKPGISGSSDITVQVEDEGGKTATGSFTVTVSDVPNSAPALGPLPDLNFGMNSGLNNNIIDMWSFASDAEDPDNSLAYSIISQTHKEIADCIVDLNRYIDCTVADGALGTTGITVKVEDTEGGTAQGAFTINVNNDPSTCPLPAGCGAVERNLYNVIAEGFDTHADIMIGNTLLPVISQFSMDKSVMLPEQYDIKEINRMVMTLSTGKGYEMIWFKDISSVDRECSKTRITLQDGESMLGTLVSNGAPRNFYSFSPGEINGMMNMGGTEKPIGLSPQCFSSINMDLSGSQQAFETQHSEILSGLSTPVTIELKDGTTVSSDSGYIVDFCGHYYSNHFHRRLVDTIELIGPDGVASAAPIGEVSEIEFTGEFDAASPQARKVIVSYKDGRVENTSLYLTSESYNGTCMPYARFRDFDSMLMHNIHGAQLFRLDNVKRIKPDQPYIPPKPCIPNEGQLEAITITSWRPSEYMDPKLDLYLRKIRDLGIDTVFILATWYQDNPDTTQIYSLTPGSNGTPTDEAIRHLVNDVKSLGMKPVIKFHVDCMNGEWRGEIGRSFDDQKWGEWFQSLKVPQVHYAQLSEELKLPLYVIGVEWPKSEQRLEWDGNISDIKGVTSIPLTYSANHNSYQNVRFINKLDYAGISAYFVTANMPNPPLSVLESFWDGKTEELKLYSQLVGKRIMFTETGYQSIFGTSTSPWWVWGADTTEGRQEQANNFQAMFSRTHNGFDPANADWMAGHAIWNYNANGIDDTYFSIMGKPAEGVVNYVYHLKDPK